MGASEQIFDGLIGLFDSTKVISYPFPFLSEKLKSFLIKRFVSTSLPNRSMNNIHQKHFFIGVLKFFLKFQKHLKKPTVTSDRSQTFYKIGILKRSAKFTRKQQCRSHFLKKSPETKRHQHRLFPGNFAKH